MRKLHVLLIDFLTGVVPILLFPASIAIIIGGMTGWIIGIVLIGVIGVVLGTSEDYKRFSRGLRKK